MFDSTSRYYSVTIQTLNTTDANGETREIRYIQRRFLPSASTGTTLVEHTVTEGERLDNLAARYLGDPTLFWRVCDANGVLNPSELTEEVGRSIRIAVPTS